MSQQLIPAVDCRKIQVKILEAVDKICDEYELEYYIAYGTLLGAVRHKGYIPWDDDIDIVMTREHYNRFIQLMEDSSISKPDWMELLDDRKTGYYYPIVKVVNNQTIAKSEDSTVEHGLWVDIFPLDNLPEDQKKRVRFVKNNLLLRSVIIAMTTDFSCETLGKKRIIKQVLNAFATVVGKKRIFDYYKRYMQKYLEEKGDYVANLYSPYGIKDIFKKSDLLVSDLYVFEDAAFKGYKNYDLFLSQIYGDYMTLPPESKRRTHKIIASYK